MITQCYPPFIWFCLDGIDERSTIAWTESSTSEPSLNHWMYCEFSTALGSHSHPTQNLKVRHCNHGIQGTRKHWHWNPTPTPVLGGLLSYPASEKKNTSSSSSTIINVVSKHCDDVICVSRQTYSDKMMNHLRLGAYARSTGHGPYPSDKWTKMYYKVNMCDMCWFCPCFSTGAYELWYIHNQIKHR